MIRSILSENRRTFALALPIMAGHVGQMLMGLIDTVMVGRVGMVPLAACAFANTLLSIPFVFGFGVLSAVSVRASHAHGSGEYGEARGVVRGGVLLALGMSVPMALFLHAALPWIGVLGQPEEINRAVGGFLLLCGWSAVPVFLTTVSKNFCEAFGRPWIPFWIVLGGVGLNAGLNWILIFGNWGFPAMGLEGAGIATLTARILTAVAVFSYPYFARDLRAGWPLEGILCESLKPAKILARIGLPSGTQHFFEVSGFAIGSIMMGWISVAGLAAHQIAITCAATTFMIPLGLSQAVCVRVGQARGAGRLESIRPIILGGVGLAVAVMGCFVVVFVLGGRTIAACFVRDATVIALTAHLLFLAGIFQIFDGIQVVSAGALRGFEDTRVPMVIGVVSYWFVALPVSYLTAFFMRMGAAGVWIGFVVGLGVAAVALFGRVVKRCGGVSPIPAATT